MPTRQVESTHDEVRQPNHPDPNPGAPGVESPSADRMNGAAGLPRRSSENSNGAEGGEMHAEPDPSAAGPRQSTPEDVEHAAAPETNQDDSAESDQDIDTAGTEADDLSPTKSLFLALTPSLQRG